MFPKPKEKQGSASSETAHTFSDETAVKSDTPKP